MRWSGMDAALQGDRSGCGTGVLLEAQTVATLGAGSPLIDWQHVFIGAVSGGHGVDAATRRVRASDLAVLDSGEVTVVLRDGVRRVRVASESGLRMGGR